jgi:uncharacterized repeat protein (TIGR03803 family)
MLKPVSWLGTRRMAALVPFLVAAVAGSAAAATPKFLTLYSFCATGYSDCADGNDPVGQLLLGSDGALYGVTWEGGSTGNLANIYGSGTVFKVTPGKTGYTETVLYAFCPKGGDCADGSHPIGYLLVDDAGNLYGTTELGGTHGKGTVFKLTFDKSKNSYTESVLYTFCSTGGTHCSDGREPGNGVIMDEHGNLYGTTVAGGAYGKGAVFKLIPSKTSKTGYVESVVYSFCARGGSACTDGSVGYALTSDGPGHFYGTTSTGGTHDGGTVFELSATRSPPYAETVIYSFCSSGGTQCTDGKIPGGGLAFDRSGNLYGTTFEGGGHASSTVFEIDAPTRKETVLYSFCSLGGSECIDGEEPDTGALAFDTQGDLYGATYFGGAKGAGTVFELVAKGRGQYREIVLHSFCEVIEDDTCTDGGEPGAGVVMSRDGTLYGSTTYGGVNGSLTIGGTVFALVP